MTMRLLLDDSAWLWRAQYPLLPQNFFAL